MKKKFIPVLIAGLVFIFLGLFSVGHAQEFRRGDNATIGSTEKIDSTAYIAGRHVDVAGEVNGDLFCAGQNINVSGTIHGDIICAGQTITITGKVDGDVRAAGQTVVIGSIIDGNLTVGAQDLTINASANIGGDVTGGVDSLVINGNIGRDVVLGASQATINGNVARNIKSGVEHLNLGNNATVGGKIKYTSYNELNRAPGAKVSGSVSRSQPKKQESHSGWFGIGFRVYWFFAMLVVALALILLFPSVFQASANRTMKSLGRTLLVGVGATLLTPIVFILLLITLVGIPLGLLLLLGWVMALILSGPFFAYLIGREIWRGQHNQILVMLLGATLLLLVYNIPWIGFIVMLAAIFIGMGMVVRELIHRTPKPNYKTK